METNNWPFYVVSPAGLGIGAFGLFCPNFSKVPTNIVIYDLNSKFVIMFTLPKSRLLILRRGFYA
jgi:hypothetical protein